MRVFRLSKAKYKDQLSGFGASLHGQRWNSKGIEMIYSAESRALAAAEVSVHISLNILPKDYHMIEIDIPDDIQIKELEVLPEGWKAIPDQGICREQGDSFIKENDYAVMKVPSVVIDGDFNFLINPYHKDFDRISIVSTKLFPFDPRLER